MKERLCSPSSSRGAWMVKVKGLFTAILLKRLCSVACIYIGTEMETVC